jgi:hypothetical protein
MVPGCFKIEADLKKSFFDDGMVIAVVFTF